MPHLPEHWARHLQAGTSHRVGTFGEGGRPQICRALVAQACSDGAIEVLLAADVGRGVITAVQATQRVAHVALQLATSASLQTKGRDAQVLPARPEHLALIAECRDRLAAEVGRYGVALEQVRDVWYDAPLPMLRCIRFTPFEATGQTPGAGAGPVELLP